MSKAWITVTTTLPQSLGLHDRCTSSNCQPEIRTKRLSIRPFTQSDLTAFHQLRSQPEFMKYTRNGRPDLDIYETQEKLDSLINAPSSPGALPFYTYFGIFLKATGELIGDGGVHILASPACGWPEFGCKFGNGYCGSGYGTEFLCAFTTWWWNLPRYQEDGAEGSRKPIPVRLRVHPDSVVWADSGDDYLYVDTGRRAVEQLYAWIAPDNYASQRMAIKGCLEHFITWDYPIKKLPVMGWRQSRYRRSIYPSKL
ncbi:acetyltransferase domain-containing protein [Nemania sp. FL0031]|nr:acetyltransferase domain-containing protein [Nemania sp. FL0031]